LKGKKAEYWYELKPAQFVLASHTSAPTTERLLGVETQDDNVQKTSNDETKYEKN